MLSDDDKTPPVMTLGTDGAKTPRPLYVVPRRPPAGRPPGALSFAEMVERITDEVQRRATADLERKHAEVTAVRAEVAALRSELTALRTELTSDFRTALGLGIAAVMMNALVIVASLAASGMLPARGVGLVLVALTAVFVGAARLASRRRSLAR
jgi:hypothetical protein